MYYFLKLKFLEKWNSQGQCLILSRLVLGLKTNCSLFEVFILISQKTMKLQVLCTFDLRPFGIGLF